MNLLQETKMNVIMMDHHELEEKDDQGITEMMMRKIVQQKYEENIINMKIVIIEVEIIVITERILVMIQILD